MPKKILYIFLILATLSLATVLSLRFFSHEDAWICEGGRWTKRGDPGSEKPSFGCGAEERIFQGIVEENLGDRFILKENSIEKIEVALSAETKLIGKDGGTSDKNDLRKGFPVKVTAIWDGKTAEAEEVRIIDEPNIIVYGPEAGATVGLPLIIRGEARVFENIFNYRLKDENGKTFYESRASAAAPDAGLYGPFEISFNYPAPAGGRGTVEVFDYSAKDGSETDKVDIPVSFDQGQPVSKFKVFFPNSRKDPGASDCNRVFAVDRRAGKTGAAARAALAELLKGPDVIEAKAGYFSNLNEGIKINSLSIDKGMAKVDFDKTIEAGVGGSCRVSGVRAEIIQTLEQFPTVKDVVISVEGRTEDILQP